MYIKLEQYKIFIESAEKNSDRRITQNNIYLTINLAFISCCQKPCCLLFCIYAHYFPSNPLKKSIKISSCAL